MSDIARIRKQYPHPQRMGSQAYYRRRPQERYCTGGAVCKYYRLEETHQFISAGGEFFPDKLTLAEALEDLNPLLGEERSYNFARAIIDNNDSERFEEAWKIADQALDWQPHRKEV